MTQPSGSAPSTDDVFNQQPRPVEDLVTESNGTLNGAPIVEMTTEGTAPSLDPQPSAPPPAPTPPAQPAPTPPAYPADEPEVIPADPAPTDQPGIHSPNEPGSEVAVAEPSNVELEVWTNDEPWDHETIDFRGDTLNVRKPTDQALAGLSLSSSRYVKMSIRNDITGLFIARHLSPQSYDRVFSRLMDPDDENYTVETIGELMGAIVGNRGDAAQ